MKTRPRAIVTQREELGSHGGPVDSLEREYVDFLDRCGFAAFPISGFTGDAAEFMAASEWNLVLLTGGGIVRRDRYRYVVSGRHQHHRDRMEEALIPLALERRIPVVGICRGMQQLNGYFGGRVSPVDGLPAPRPVREQHPVRTREGASFPVNHFHRDGLFPGDLGAGMEPLAWDEENGLVEALAHRDLPALGVQWHPERLDWSAAANDWFRARLAELLEKAKAR